RQPDQGGRLVRQRVGLLQPPRRPDRVRGRLPVMIGIDELDVKGRRVFVRADLNVPLDEGTITDDGRIRASVPTIRKLLERGARVIVGAHPGRPKGTPTSKYSLAPVSRRLAELLGQDVAFATDVVGESAR